MGPGPRRHIQSVQVDPVQLASRSAAAIRADWRRGLPVACGTRRRAKGMQLHWDGDNDSVDERNLSAALGAGVTPVTVDHAAMKRVRDWIWTLPPPQVSVSDRPGAGRARRAAVRAALPELPRRQPVPRRRDRARDARRPGRADRRHRHGSRIVSTRTPTSSPRISTRCIRTRRTGSRISERRTDTRTIRWTASGCADRTSTTARCRRCATLLDAPEAAAEGVLPRL